MNGYESDSLQARKDLARACKSIAEQFVLLNARLADIDLVISLFLMESKAYTLTDLVTKLSKMRQDLKEMELRGVKDLIPKEKRERYGI